MHRCKASYRQSNSKVRSPVLMLKCNATDIRSHAAPAPRCSRLDSGKNNALDHTPTSWTQGHIANHLTKITTNAHTPFGAILQPQGLDWTPFSPGSKHCKRDGS